MQYDILHPLRFINCVYMKSGIYRISSPSGKQYVGSTTDFKRRWRAHLGELRRGTHHSQALQAAFDKYGESAMRFEVITLCAPEELLKREQLAFDLFRPEYNVCYTAGNRLGVPHSTETREKMSASKKGIPQKPEYVAKRAAANRNRSEESREKSRKIATGRKHSDEAKAKISAANTGKKRTPEQIETLRNAGIGRTHSEETKAKMREARKHVTMPPVSDATRALLSSQRRGVPKSDSWKAAMRASWARRKAAKAAQ
jgi:group I intron endonuclease